MWFLYVQHTPSVPSILFKELRSACFTPVILVQTLTKLLRLFLSFTDRLGNQQIKENVIRLSIKDC